MGRKWVGRGRAQVGAISKGRGRGEALIKRPLRATGTSRRTCQRRRLLASCCTGAVHSVVLRVFGASMHRPAALSDRVWTARGAGYDVRGTGRVPQRACCPRDVCVGWVQVGLLHWARRLCRSAHRTMAHPLHIRLLKRNWCSPCCGAAPAWQREASPQGPPAASQA